MTERPGLSIFDNQPSQAPSDDDTQEIPPVSTAPAARPGFPVVRRGYDTAAVDRQIQALTREKGSLTADLDEANRRARALETKVASLEEQIRENKNPTYAGLGGRASEMLRLAEEQADEVLRQAKNQAQDILRQATKDADVLRAQAARDAEDMRMVQLKELDETRSRAMAEV